MEEIMEKSMEGRGRLMEGVVEGQWEATEGHGRPRRKAGPRKAVEGHGRPRRQGTCAFDCSKSTGQCHGRPDTHQAGRSSSASGSPPRRRTPAAASAPPSASSWRLAASFSPGAPVRMASAASRSFSACASCCCERGEKMEGRADDGRFGVDGEPGPSCARVDRRAEEAAPEPGESGEPGELGEPRALDAHARAILTASGASLGLGLSSGSPIGHPHSLQNFAPNSTSSQPQATHGGANCFRGSAGKMKPHWQQCEASAGCRKALQL